MDLNFAEFLEEYVPIMPESIKDGILNRLTYSENLTKFGWKFMLFVCIHGMPQNCFLWHIFRIWSCF